MEEEAVQLDLVSSTLLHGGDIISAIYTTGITEYVHTGARSV